jgi:hypothetical protein
MRGEPICGDLQDLVCSEHIGYAAPVVRSV